MVQGTSCTARLRGNARHVSLLGLGKREQAGKAATLQGQAWGTTPGKAAGVALAAACKGCKAKSAAVACVGGEGGALSAQVPSAPAAADAACALLALMLWLAARCVPSRMQLHVCCVHNAVSLCT